MHILKKGKHSGNFIEMNYLVGVGVWWTWGGLCCLLDDPSREDLSFLSWDSGGSTSKGLSPLRSRLGWVWPNSHYHFLHWRWSLAKENIRGGWEKVEWLPVICHRFWTILLLQARWVRLAKRSGRGLRKNKSTDSVPLPQGLHIQDQFAAVEGLKLFWIREFSAFPTKC